MLAIGILPHTEGTSHATLFGTETEDPEINRTISYSKPEA